MCIKDAEDIIFQKFSVNTNFRFEKCDQSLLEAGQTCFEGDELKDYLSNITISIGFLHNYIENENIEKPVQTIHKPRTYYRLHEDRTITKKFRL